MTRHDFPDDYIPLNYCRACGNDFTKVAYFDRHRIGTHEYDYSIDRPDGRRCMNTEEMLEAGLSKVQLGDSPKYDKRLEFDVPLWWDRTEVEKARRAFAATSSTESGS